MERELFIRDANIADAERLVEIYSYYVLNTSVSFEYEVPSVAEFENRIKMTKERYPYVVCILNDKIVGYAYAGAYSSRQAYNWTATTSVYVDKDYRSVNMTKENLKNLGIDQKVFKCDAVTFLMQCKESFDLIILDPPYKSGLYEKVLPIIYDNKLVSADGIVVCEHASGDEFYYGNFQVFDEKKYGNITLTYLKI